MHSPRKIEFDGLIAKFEQQKGADLPFVVYRYPNTTEVHALFQNDDTKHFAKSFEEQGFVFAPFDARKNTILLKPDAYFISEYQHNIEINSNKESVDEDGKSNHIELIKKGLDELLKENLEKVVLSRIVDVKTKRSFLSMFMAALNHYPNAFCYLWFHPRVGMWLGASPEKLLQINNGVVHTTSLAGTLPVIKDEMPQWTKKEIDEQEMVTRFLLNELNEVLSDVTTSKVNSVKAGKLWHLKTNITASLRQNNSLQELIFKIHPSPAICGVPKEKAKNFILKNEGYDRDFYTGFLGPLNMRESKYTKLFVNLRCMRVVEEKVTIFVGGGITKDSNPEDEWQETKNKTQTMCSLL